MSQSSKKKSNGHSEVIQKDQPRSIAVAEKGIHTSQDVKNLMANVAIDVIANRMTPSVANAACNSIGKLLKTVEMEYKYGRQLANGERLLALTEATR